jgi:catechol 2,3-dioxygenase-like lactoylglutathione lyase family enzyme
VLGTSAFVGFVPTTDLARARSFYEGTLGLSCTEENPIACVFDADGTVLRVTAVPALTPAGYTIAGWLVDDIGSAVARLRDAGVGFLRFDGMDQDDLGVWTTPDGSKVAWFNDPDGNVLSLTQSL